MKEKVFNQTLIGQSLLWFGAAVSIAEIVTGMLIGSLGIKIGIAAVIIGHTMGAAILFLAGYIGAKERGTTPEVIKISLGRKGNIIFSLFNIIQLVGWTSVMIINGAQALNGVAAETIGYTNEKLWCIVIGIFICFWILVGLKKLTIINGIVCALFFVFFLIMGYKLLFINPGEQSVNSMAQFGIGVELNVTMVLSWLPLISDYTSNTDKPIKGTAISVLSYSIGSIIMFCIGLLAAIVFKEADISYIILTMGLGEFGLFIIAFSTVTTTYLDTFSVGICVESINKKFGAKQIATITCIIGTLIAILVPNSRFEDFLYFIGSIFAPLFAILFTDYFILHRKANMKELDIENIMLWILGFVLYRVFMNYNTMLGNTFPTIIIVMLIKSAYNKMLFLKGRK